MKRDAAGESLIELIVAMAILSVSMVAIVAGFLGLAKVSGLQRDQGNALAALTSASEYAKNRPCVSTGTCVVESAVSPALVPHDGGSVISVSAPSLVALVPGGPSLTQYVVTVTTTSGTYTNPVVVR